MNGTFLETEVYILFTLILVAWYQKLRIAELSELSKIVGISESKLVASVLEQEINIHNYKILHFDRNRHKGSVVCYVRNNYNIENIFFEILLLDKKINE